MCRRLQDWRWSSTHWEYNRPRFITLQAAVMCGGAAINRHYPMEVRAVDLVRCQPLREHLNVS